MEASAAAAAAQLSGAAGGEQHSALCDGVARRTSCVLVTTTKYRAWTERVGELVSTSNGGGDIRVVIRRFDAFQVVNRREEIFCYCSSSASFRC